MAEGAPREITLENEHLRAVVTDFGARLVELHVPDRAGERADVVLAPPGLTDLPGDRSYFGATVGRYAGRIANAAFSLDGVEHRLAANEGVHHVHGGVRGFDQRRWSAEPAPDGSAVTFRRRSAAGEEGYPGTLDTAVTYRLDGHSLGIVMTATTDASTVVRLVHHSYWNLRGHDAGSVLDHVLRIDAAEHVPLDADLLPSGGLRRVAGTPYDFQEPRPLAPGNALVRGGRGYDDVWALAGSGLRPVATLSDPVSGRGLVLESDQPGLCVYAGGHLAGVPAKGARPAYEVFAGLALEPTGFPDDVNRPGFPSPVLRPGEVYRNEMRLTFTVA